ncbi:MAG: hypothetical protein Q9211_001098 [Gyalolechia sp. 1 TL-2023]
MAEPLSVTASIAGLVTLADVIFGRIFKYVQAVKGASKEITALSSEVGALYGILNNLHLVSRQLEEQSLSSAPRIHHIGSCHKTLEKLKAILDTDDPASAQTQCDKFKRKLHWPFSSSQVKTLLAEIERHKATLGLALNVDGVSGLLRSLSLQNETRDAVEGIKAELKQKHEADTRIAINAKRQSVLKSFGGIDPGKNQKMSLRLRQLGTGSWLIESQEFQHWCQTKNAKLWLYGIPGAGKTVLASTVIEEVLRGSSVNHAVAFFYCDYKDPATQKPHLVLGSLIQQIAKQDEQSFEKVQTFCDRQSPECTADYNYDSHELRDLILDIVSCFDSATIVVDGLDECGSNMAEVTELLTSLHLADEETNMRTLFLSRDEVDVRQWLESYAKVAIAARSSDLRLYVGAEIDLRIRKGKLRIKDQSLKGYIMEKLVAEADGMFRWVACQMDYMCELPNDSSRRKELGNLPKTLHATYERILRRVNASNSYVQLLVSRTLRWIVHRVQEAQFSTATLCEAVSINLGDAERNADGISDELEILRWCSSLVRRAADGANLELAHFTVKEFLLQIDDNDEREFAIFRIGVGHDDIELAKVCLTYLSFRDFDNVSYADEEVTRCRFQQYPLREYAVSCWPDHAKNYLGDNEIFSLTKQLLNPSKPGTFISWVQDVIDYQEWSSGAVDDFIAETTPLHFAAMLGLAELCIWLIERGCDVNRDTIIGSPLWCHLAPPRSLGFAMWLYFRYQPVTSILLEAGADANYNFDRLRAPDTLLFSCIDNENWESATELLKKGATLDKHSLAMLEHQVKGSEETAWRSTIEHIRTENVEDEHRPRILDLFKASKSDEPNILAWLGLDGENTQLRNTDYEPALRTAARFGQVQVVRQLLRVPKIDLQAAEEETGFTALHYAAMNDNPEIVKLLWTHGAQHSNTDSRGKTAVHYAALESPSCLEYFLEQGVDDVPPDNEGFTLWHAAACFDNAKSLDVLRRYRTPIPCLNEIKTIDGRSPLLCAARNGNTECIDWLLQAGCTVMDVANDGSTALHLASKSGSLQAVQLCLDQGSDINAVTRDGSTVLHHALLELHEGSNAIVDLLVQRGVDLSRDREDGIMPVHLLIAHTINEELLDEQEKVTLTGQILNERSTTMSEIVGYHKVGHDKLVAIFKTFLANDIDLGTQNSRGKSALLSLADVWRISCLKEHMRKARFKELCLTRMIHMAMEKVPLTGPLHMICTDPDLTISALLVEDEDLVYKFLEHSPDVDASSDKSSIIKTACATGCSPTLFEQLLMRSSTASNKNVKSSLLRLACQAKEGKSLGIVDVLLNQGCSPNDQCPVSGESPLTIGARHGNVDIVNLLIHHGADTYALDKAGCNVAHHACVGGHIGILRALRNSSVDWNSAFKGGALEYFLDENLINDIDQVTDGFQSALFLATWTSSLPNVASLLSRGANATTKETIGGSCPIHIAARDGDKAIVSLFLQYKCDVEVFDNRGLSCEMIARKSGHKDVANMLREYNEKQAQKFATVPSQRKKPPHWSEALRVAIDLADTDLCRRVIEDGANLSLGFDQCQGCAPLLYALGDSTRTGAQLEIVELLAREGPSVKGATCNLKVRTRGFTALHYAAGFGYFHLLQILLDKDPMMILELCTSVHPFHLAVLEGHYDCVELIVTHYGRYAAQNGSPFVRKPRNATSILDLVEMQVACTSTQRPLDVESVIAFFTVLNSTPLQIAAHRGHVRIARFLLEHGVSIDAAYNHGWSVLHFAAAAPKDETLMVELLLDYGANLQAVDRSLRTPLMLAAMNGNLDVLQVLVARGADLQMQDRYCQTALHYAARSHSISTIVCLLMGGTDHDLACEDNFGWTPLSTLLADGALDEILFTINLAPSPRAYEPKFGNILAYAVLNTNMIPSLLKKLLKRLSRPVVATLLRHQSKLWGTPLYAACTAAPLNRQEAFINMLLEAGADLEQEGGRHGTPLMGACAAGRFATVKLLVSRGAKIVYEKDGITISALKAAKHFPKIMRWLLVERYTMGPRRICQG